MSTEPRVLNPSAAVTPPAAVRGAKPDAEFVRQELSRIPFARLGFHATALTDLTLNPFKGTAIRGLLGHHLRPLLVAAGTTPEAADCLFGDLWGRAMLPSDDRGKVPEKSRPYVVVPPLSTRRFFACGESLQFGIHLFGAAIDLARPIIDAFERGGRECGLSGAVLAGATGRTTERNRFGLEFVEATERGGRRRIVWSRDRLHAAVLPVLRLADVAQGKVGVRELEIEFVTPTNLRSNHRHYDRADLGRLVEQILSRARALALDHAGVDLDPTLAALVDAAAGMRLVSDRTRWVSFRRSSSRQGEYVNVGGLVGSARWVGELDSLLPVLELGRILGVGKTAVSGCGRYELRWPGVGATRGRQGRRGSAEGET